MNDILQCPSMMELSTIKFDFVIIFCYLYEDLKVFIIN